MSRQEALYQSIAASGAMVIAFIGVCHEAVGETLFPWGPAFFGGPIIWHALGLMCIAAGLAMFAGALRVIAFPVIAAAWINAVAGFAVFCLTMALHGRFHVFALTLCIAGVAIAICHRRAIRLAGAASI